MATFFPSEHFGVTKKRKWHKVRWNEKANPGLIGRVDILSDDGYAKQKSFADVLETIETEKCAGGTPLGFGKLSEEKIY